MSERIEVGDLVIKVRPTYCCGATCNLGRIHCVVVDDSWTRLVVCDTCGKTVRNIDTVKLDNGTYCELTRLRKIPPLTEPEHTTEEISA